MSRLQSRQSSFCKTSRWGFYILIAACLSVSACRSNPHPLDVDLGSQDDSTPLEGNESDLDPSFTLILQTSGDWSGNYTGSYLGFTDHTRILYEHEAAAFNPNGPEYVNFEEHIAKFISAVHEKVPEGFNGIAIIDYEGYPLTLYSPCHHPDICEPRIAQEFTLYPDITLEEAERRANEKYEPFIKKYFLEPLRKAKELRPNAQWGFYSRLSGDRNLPTDDRHRWKNDQVDWLWNESNVITRSIYPYWHENEPHWPRTRDLMQDKIEEAARLARNVQTQTGRKPVVLSYVSSRVMSNQSQYQGQWVTQTQISDQLRSSSSGGADGVIFWENVRNDRPPNPTEQEYIHFLDTIVKASLMELQMGVFAP